MTRGEHWEFSFSARRCDRQVTTATDDYAYWGRKWMFHPGGKARDSEPTTRAELASSVTALTSAWLRTTSFRRREGTRRVAPPLEHDAGHAPCRGWPAAPDVPVSGGCPCWPLARVQTPSRIGTLRSDDIGEVHDDMRWSTTGPGQALGL
jgi:hypothetical protein